MSIARLSTLAIVIAAAAAVAATVVAGVPLLAQTKPAAQTKASQAAVGTQHKVAIQVNQNDKAVMDLALNNAKNIADYFKSQGETVAIELVAYGPGLHMLRSDTSPVKERIAVMSLENPNLTFAACGNTQANQAKAENKPVTLLGEATVTPSGVVRLMELQKQGYAYIRP
jgi:intracellular sulfur oxidation DsrE/DsrF family protein